MWARGLQLLVGRGGGRAGAWAHAAPAARPCPSAFPTNVHRHHAGLAASTPAAGPEGEASTSSVDPTETAKFAAVADEWWAARGPFRPLHAMNPPRVAFISGCLQSHYGEREGVAAGEPLKGLSVLDVGCGGGLLCEALTRLGATVLGVDATPDNCAVADEHAALDPVVRSRVTYRATTAEALVEEGATFDAVVSMEVVEHVHDPEAFCRSIVALTKPEGALFMSTMSRSLRALATAVVAAEYVLSMVPRGTHDWSKFLTPEELVLMVHRGGGKVQEIAGMSYNPTTNKWAMSTDTEVNYMMYCSRTSGPTVPGLHDRAGPNADAL